MLDAVEELRPHRKGCPNGPADPGLYFESAGVPDDDVISYVRVFRIGDLVHVPKNYVLVIEVVVSLQCSRERRESPDDLSLSGKVDCRDAFKKRKNLG